MSSRARLLCDCVADQLSVHDVGQAIVATGNSVLTVIYHLLAHPEARFCDLGPGYYESRINKHRRARDLATQLQALTVQHIVIRDGKAIITDIAA